MISFQRIWSYLLNKSLMKNLSTKQKFPVTANALYKLALHQMKQDNIITNIVLVVNIIDMICYYIIILLLSNI